MPGLLEWSVRASECANFVVSIWAEAAFCFAGVPSPARKYRRRQKATPVVYNRIGLEGKRHGAVPMLRGAALAYARRGVPVFPCEPGGKKPLTRNGFWDATTEARRIEAWWARWPGANVGVPTGRRSGLLVLDADPRDGGLDSLTLLERERGPLPGTAKARTGGGGVHVFFAYPAVETVRNSAGLLGAGLDVRGEGGYVVVPPSRTRGSYEWTDRSPAAEPGWLLARLRERAGEETLF